jgi:hypothetical protein
LLYPAILFGAIMILVKPHYMLMPLLMIGWRFLKGRDMRALLQPEPDMIIILATAMVYAALCVTVFSGYINVILPDALEFYSARRSLNLPWLATGLAAMALFAGATAKLEDEGRQRFLIMLGCATACLIAAYVAQGKGLYYQALPMLIVLGTTFAALGLFFFTMARDRLLFIVALVIALMALFPVKPAFPMHRDYPNLPLSKMLADCKQPCSFFVSNDYAFMSYETAMYTHGFFASRFPSLWFEPPLNCAIQAHENTPATDAQFTKYAGMVAEDFARWKPSIVALYKGDDICPDGRKVPFDFIGFFSHDPRFAQEWKHYRPDKPLDFNRRVYFRDTTADHDYPMHFDVYKRTD